MTELGLETGGLGAWSVLFSFIDSGYIMEWGTGEPGEDTQQPSSFALFLMSCHLTHLPWNESTEVTYSPVEAALSFFLKGLEPKLHKTLVPIIFTEMEVQECLAQNPGRRASRRRH